MQLPSWREKIALVTLLSLLVNAIDPFEWTPRSHGVTTTTHKIPTLGLED